MRILNGTLLSGLDSGFLKTSDVCGVVRFPRIVCNCKKEVDFWFKDGDFSAIKIKRNEAETTCVCSFCGREVIVKMSLKEYADLCYKSLAK